MNQLPHDWRPSVTRAPSGGPAERCGACGLLAAPGPNRRASSDNGRTWRRAAVGSCPRVAPRWVEQLPAEEIARLIASGFEPDPPEPTPAELATALSALPRRERADPAESLSRLVRVLAPGRLPP